MTAHACWESWPTLLFVDVRVRVWTRARGGLLSCLCPCRCLLQNLRREYMRNNDRALSNIEALPGGFNALRQLYENVQVCCFAVAWCTTAVLVQHSMFWLWLWRSVLV
jgi:hypothetical protein